MVLSQMITLLWVGEISPFWYFEGSNIVKVFVVIVGTLWKLKPSCNPLIKLAITLTSCSFLAWLTIYIYIYQLSLDHL